MGEAFRWWKPSTLGDYLYILVLIAVAALVFAVYTWHLKRRRNDTDAKKQVHRRLRWLLRGRGKVWTDVVLREKGHTVRVDHLVVDRSGILLLRTFGWGIFVQGQPRGDTWKVSDRKRSEQIPNPVLELEAQIPRLTAILSAHGVYRVPITPVAVFADNHDQPRFSLGKAANACGVQGLKGLVASKRDEKTVDVDAVAAAIEHAMERKDDGTAVS